MPHIVDRVINTYSQTLYYPPLLRTFRIDSVVRHLLVFHTPLHPALLAERNKRDNRCNKCPNRFLNILPRAHQRRLDSRGKPATTGETTQTHHALAL